MKHTRVVSLNARQAKPGVHLVDTTRVFHCQWTHNQVFLLLSHMLIQNAKSIFIYVMKYVSGFIWKLGINFAVFYQVDWWNLMEQSVTVGAQLLWSGRYGYNNGRYGCYVMSYIEINKAVSQWLLTFNLCVSVTWPLTCAFHIPCTHTPEIIDMHRGMCDNANIFRVVQLSHEYYRLIISWIVHILPQWL